MRSSGVRPPRKSARLLVFRHYCHEMMRLRGRSCCFDGGAVFLDRPSSASLAVRPMFHFSSLARCSFPLVTMKKPSSNHFRYHRVRWLQNDPAAVRVWPSTGELCDELQLIGFLLFWPIRSYGYYAWWPYNIKKKHQDDPDPDEDDGKNNNKIQYEPLDAIIDAQDIIDRLDLTTSHQPPPLRNEADLARIRLPYFFRGKKHSITHAAGLWYENNQFPYGQLAAVDIHAATQRGVDWHTIDFCFSGSSVFAMLADRGVVTKTTSKDRRGNPRTTTSIDNDRSFYCCMIPHTSTTGGGHNTILIADGRNMKVHWNDAYHQFTRLVTTGLASALAEHDNPQEIVLYHHLHMLQVGELYNILCMTEVEAVTAENTDRPVAMTTTHPFRWEMLALNMIGSGCAMLCEGRQRPGCLTNITMHSLSKVAKDTIHDRDHIERIETNILRGLHDIREQLQDDDGQQQTFQIVFVDSKLQLVPIQQANVLLPNDAVMKALLATTTTTTNQNNNSNMGALGKENSTD
jgi:hypothetical protein